MSSKIKMYRWLIFGNVLMRITTVSEYLTRWLGMGVTGAQPTRLIFHSNNLDTAIVAIQHPTSGNDAVWEIKFGCLRRDVSNVQCSHATTRCDVGRWNGHRSSPRASSTSKML
jgi:hypothetical protein